jgi:hypothetical protein
MRSQVVHTGTKAGSQGNPSQLDGLPSEQAGDSLQGTPTR